MRGGNIACRKLLRVNGNALTCGSYMSADAIDTYLDGFFPDYILKDIYLKLFGLLLLQIPTGQTWQGVCIVVDSL